MNCEKCMCKYGPYPIIIEQDAYRNVDIKCPNIKTVRTEDATFYVCPKSGMPNKPIGWYPGRGY